MIDHIKQLEQASRQLEPDAARRTELLHHVLDYAEHFIQTIPEKPAFVADERRGRGLLESPISEDGIDVEQALALLDREVDRPGVNPTSDRFFGYIPGGALFHSALGDFLAAVANRYAGFFFASPGAVRMEELLLRWMAEVVGYPATAAGNLTSGGSIGNLIAIVAARDACAIQGEAIGRAVVYMTEQVHHAIFKSLRIAGLGSCVQRFVSIDERYRMSPPALEAAIQADREAGLRPWLLIASAGTTNTGSVDPLPALADIAEAHDLWFHVDGAYGAFFVLCEPGRRVLQGMDRSDSIVLDPHKTLFLPYGTGAVLVKDRAAVLASHHYQAEYMQDGLIADELLSPADLSPELTKHFRGLRLWLPLKLLGLSPFRAALEEKMRLAQYFHRRLGELDGWEVGPPPDLSVVTYRYLPKRGDPNVFNQRLVEEIHRDGRIFISSTVLDGNFTLRLAVVVYRTHLEDIELAIEVLNEKARALENGMLDEE